HRIPHSARASEEEVFFSGDAQRQHVHQRVLSVAGLELNFAANGGHAEAVAIERDAADHTVEDAAIAPDGLGAGVIVRDDGPEAQRVEHSDGPGAHGEDVAQDAADAGRGALERFNVARVVVRLDLEHSAQAVADLDHTGVLSRALQHLRAASWQAAKVDLARLVGAVLAPHYAEDAEFSQVGLTPQDGQHARVLFGRQAVVGGQLRRNFYFCFEHHF